MLTISKPLSAAQVRTYHAEEFSNARHNYYTADDQIRGAIDTAKGLERAETGHPLRGSERLREEAEFRATHRTRNANPG